MKIRQEKGITLVALIITIIVLLILAMVSIRLVMNGGIIGRAERGSEAYSDAEIEEQLKLAYQEYQMAKYSENEYTLQNALAKTGLNITSVEGDDSTGYEVTVNTTNGEKIYELQPNGTVGLAVIGPWTQNGKIITNLETNQTLEIGQKVNYNEGTGYSFTTDTSKGMGASATEKNETGKYDLTSGTYTTENLDWVVLGLNKKRQVELISTVPHSIKVALANEEGYIYGPEELDKMCNMLYGKGTGAIKARSINIEDINTLSNVKEEDKKLLDNRYGKYVQYRFSNEVRFGYRESLDNMITWGNWTDHPSESVLNNSAFKMVGESEPIISPTKIGETEAIKNTFYHYYAKTRIINTISEEFANLVVNTDNNQWLASGSCYPDDDGVSWKLFILGGNEYYMGCGYITNNEMFFSRDGSNSRGCEAFRPIVALKPDISIQWNEIDNQWEIQ